MFKRKLGCSPDPLQTGACIFPPFQISCDRVMQSIQSEPSALFRIQFIPYTRIIPPSSCLWVNMGCAQVILFQVRSLSVPQKTGHLLRDHFWECLVFRLHSKIGQIHLSVEAQCDHHIRDKKLTRLKFWLFMLMLIPSSRARLQFLICIIS